MWCRFSRVYSSTCIICTDVNCTPAKFWAEALPWVLNFLSCGCSCGSRPGAGACLERLPNAAPPLLELEYCAESKPRWRAAARQSDSLCLFHAKPGARPPGLYSHGHAAAYGPGKLSLQFHKGYEKDEVATCKDHSLEPEPRAEAALGIWWHSMG